MKKTLVLLILLSFSFFLFSAKQEVRAVETSNTVAVEGAQVRTTGNEGLRFVAKTEVDADSYGIAVAFGEADANIDFIVGGSVNGKSVLSAQVEKKDSEGRFRVTLWDIPEDSYVQKVTARAFYVVSGVYTYADTVSVRSLFAVSISACANPEDDAKDSDIVNNVLQYVEENYRKIDYDKFGNLYINHPFFESNADKIGQEFMKDWNTFANTNVTFYNKTGYVSGSLLNSMFADSPSGSNLNVECKSYQFCTNQNYYKKWGWLLDLCAANTQSTWMKNQVKLIKKEITDVGQWYGGAHIFGSVCGFFNMESIGTGLADIQWNSMLNIYAELSVYNKTIFVNPHEVNLVKVGTEFQMPEMSVKLGYRLKWKNDNKVVDDRSFYLVENENIIFQPVEEEITYTITYMNGDEILTDLTPTEYNITTNTFNLPSLLIDGYIFNGWYTVDGSVTGEWGESVSSVLKGSTGDKVYYAKFTQTAVPTKQVNVEFISGSHKEINNAAMNVSENTYDLKITTSTTAKKGILSTTYNPSIASSVFGESQGGQAWYRIYLVYEPEKLAYKVVAKKTYNEPLNEVGVDYTHAIVVHDQAAAPYKEAFTAVKELLSDPYLLNCYIVLDREFVANSGDIGFYVVKSPDHIIYNNIPEFTSNVYTFEEGADPQTLPDAPDKSGFEFVGWYADPEFTGTAVTEFDYDSVQNKYYAKYEPLQ